MPISPRLLNAYRRTRYAAGTIEVRIGRRSPAMDQLLTEHGVRLAVFVTAWNPLSNRMPPRWNYRMQDRLRDRLRGYRVQTAEGSWRRWREEHFLVLAAPNLILPLARRFRQAAVVVVKRGQPAALMTSFPVFSPVNNIPSARGAFSNPSTICSRCWSRPPRICAASHARASG